MEIQTSRCTKFGHREFTLCADEAQVPESYILDVVRTIESMVESGEVFRPEETFQVGWMTTKIVEDDSGNLSLMEPDTRSLPIQWVPGITETLRTLMLQLFALDSVRLRKEMQAPSIRQSVTVCTQYASPNFFMNRLDPLRETDSGWFIGCVGDSHDHQNPDNLSCISLYEAFLHQKGIQGFVSFPTGSVIACEKKDGLSIWKDGNELTIESGSFLDEWLKKRP